MRRSSASAAGPTEASDGAVDRDFCVVSEVYGWFTGQRGSAGHTEELSCNGRGDVRQARQERRGSAGHTARNLVEVGGGCAVDPAGTANGRGCSAAGAGRGRCGGCVAEHSDSARQRTERVERIDGRAKGTKNEHSCVFGVRAGPAAPS